MTGAALIPGLAWAVLAGLAGFAAGWLHFASLAQVTRLFLQGRLAAVWLQLARLALLAGVLFLCARGGAPMLIAAGTGLALARLLVLRRAARQASAPETPAAPTGGRQ